jgi:hypothetical protein
MYLLFVIIPSWEDIDLGTTHFLEFFFPNKPLVSVCRLYAPKE